MDLAVKDIRRHLGKFVATIVGVSMLLAIVLVMNGIYRGNIADGAKYNPTTDTWTTIPTPPNATSLAGGSQFFPGVTEMVSYPSLNLALGGFKQLRNRGGRS